MRQDEPASAGSVAAGSVADVLVAVGVLLVAAVLATVGDGAGVVRYLFAGLVVFLVPGYLLLEALLPSNQPGAPPRAWRLAAAVGLSPALVGLLALATALVPGAFRPGTIIAVITLACIAFAAVAVLRRQRGVAAAAAAHRTSPPADRLGPRGS